MHLVLCEPSDASALWAWRALRARGLEVELVTSAALAAPARWEHRIEDGRATTRVDLADGRRIDSRELTGVLNRLVTAPRPPAAAVPGDRAYAQQELWALWISWLAGLPEPMLGRPGPQGLCGPWLHDSQWTLLAARAGLRTAAWRGEGAAATAAAATLLVVAGAVLGRPAPAEVVAGAQALARAAGCSVLGVSFGPEWTFAGAGVVPDLRWGADPLLAVLARALGAP